jgi:hypothetical protein
MLHQARRCLQPLEWAKPQLIMAIIPDRCCCTALRRPQKQVNLRLHSQQVQGVRRSHRKPAVPNSGPHRKRDETSPNNCYSYILLHRSTLDPTHSSVAAHMALHTAVRAHAMKTHAMYVCPPTVAPILHVCVSLDASFDHRYGDARAFNIIKHFGRRGLFIFKLRATVRRCVREFCTATHSVPAGPLLAKQQSIAQHSTPSSTV